MTTTITAQQAASDGIASQLVQRQEPERGEGEGKRPGERSERRVPGDLVTLSPEASVQGGLNPSRAVTPAEKKALLEDAPPRRFSVYG